MQAWVLKKCMTLYNDICRRPHLPRESAIRVLMAQTGVDLTLYGPSSSDDLEQEEEEQGEQGEEELEEHDECAPHAKVDLICNHI